MSGLIYAKKIGAMKQVGYHVEIIYLQLASPRLALRRIAGRVLQGGHNVTMCQRPMFCGVSLFRSKPAQFRDCIPPAGGFMGGL